MFIPDSSWSVTFGIESNVDFLGESAKLTIRGAAMKYFSWDRSLESDLRRKSGPRFQVYAAAAVSLHQFSDTLKDNATSARRPCLAIIRKRR